MEPYEEDNLFETFKAVIFSAIQEKEDIPKWKKKIEKIHVKVNLTLQVDKQEYFPVNLIIENGSYSFNRGKLEDFDLEMIAAPEDLMYFCNKTFSTVQMVTKKNEFGKKKLRLKKGFRNVSKLLFVSKLLIFE